MSTVQEIEAAIQHLSATELAELKEWLFDHGIERDAESGLLDGLSSEAVRAPGDTPDAKAPDNRRALAFLRDIAARGDVTVADPVAWQRATRAERHLPGRS